VPKLATAGRTAGQISAAEATSLLAMAVDKCATGSGKLVEVSELARHLGADSASLAGAFAKIRADSQENPGTVRRLPRALLP